MAAPPHGGETASRQVLAVHLAVSGTMAELSQASRRLSGELSRLKASTQGLCGGNSDVFGRFIEQGEHRLRWLDTELAAARRLTTATAEVQDPDMRLALLRLAGPRLEAALLGAPLLAMWLDFLHLADVLLTRRLYSKERLFVDLERVHGRLEPAMTALSSLEPGQMRAVAEDMPALLGHFTGEFAATCTAARQGEERVQQLRVLQETLEAFTLLSALRLSLPALPPSAPLVVGQGLAMGTPGVMMGTRVVISAEWVETMRRLVRAGVLSLPAVGAAVRLQSGQVQMMGAPEELPRGVREALGDGPEVRAMHPTDRAGAGMAESPRHHVLPREHREWFEQRGFTGELSIDRFCVRMEQAHHQAIHGGGDWRLGRTWPGEWNRMIMKALLDTEARSGRMLTPSQLLKIVAGYMKEYDIPMNFMMWRGP
ncbi:DUF2380 domain-containing protein [Archangium primigenium]|uniref:DUF2380 domain-containing protein n=1 Tax=[Archangium] primigenium TaxID=2792470 RepID=UPI0019572EED|nr:DUF2380 domain-containing protein [Archangium primigenium]MBM7119278.1 DUF2380 domain-containing protein [Archangium primigenium]